MTDICNQSLLNEAGITGNFPALDLKIVLFSKILRDYEEKMLILIILRIAILWRQCRESYFLWIYYGKIRLEILGSLYEEHMVN